MWCLFLSTKMGICQLLGDEKLEQRTIGEGFFSFSKNKDVKEKQGTIGVALNKFLIMTTVHDY